MLAGRLSEILKHFVIEIVYTAPFEKVEPVVPDHRAYLQSGYKSGTLLLSGPQSPRVGGILIARAGSMEAIQTFCDGDPYAKAGVAQHRVIEFLPMSYQPFLGSWVQDE